MAQLLRNFLQNSIDLVFPPCCSGCGRVDTRWCHSCQAELADTPVMTDIIMLDDAWSAVASGAHEGRLQDAVQALKYENVIEVADILGQRLSECLQHMHWTFDMVIPVPLHQERLRARGYNQAEKIATALATQILVPCEPDALSRERETRSQVGLNREERLQNVEDAFFADADRVSGRTVLLVDDVRTTGATLISCAAALSLAGCSGVYAITVTAAHRTQST